MKLRNPLSFLPVAALAAFLPLAGCGTIAPDVISKDRVNFSHELSASWQKQLLLNVVKLRYLDMPMFTDVSQIVAGYNLESSIRLLGLNPNDPQGTLNLGAEGKYVDRPTISYTPLSGTRYYKNLLLPIPPVAVMFMINSGWAADMILPIAVDSINGIRGPVGFGINAQEGHPEFDELVTRLRRIQLSRAIGMRLQGKETMETMVVFFRQQDVDPAIEADILRVREILELEPGRQEFLVSYGTVQQGGGNIALNTRALLAILLELAATVDVPAEDLAEGRAMPAMAAKNGSDPRMMHIHSGSERPADAFVAVPYRNKWFWIDDRDLISKRTMAFMMILFSLAEGEGKASLPVLTIPTG